MRTTLFLLTALTMTLVLIATPGSAYALGPVEIELAAQAGYGSNPSRVGPVKGTSPGNFGTEGIASSLHGGAGGRVGASFSALYAGLSLKYYVGESGTLGTPATGAAGDIYGTAHTLTFGGELGYNIRPWKRLTIRPQLGFGNVDRQLDVASLSAPPLSKVAFDTNFVYLEPGLTALVSFGVFFVGADANLFLLPTDQNARPALTAHGQMGARF